MDAPDSTPNRPEEAQLMARLDTIWRKAEEAMLALQDDGRLSGPEDKNTILRCVHTIEAQAKRIREMLTTSGVYSSLRDAEEPDPDG